MKSGFYPWCRCRPRQKWHSTCMVFNIHFSFPLKWSAISWSPPTSTDYFSNSFKSYVTSNFCKVPNLNRLFLNTSGSYDTREKVVGRRLICFWVLLYITLPAYLSHMQGVWGYWHKILSMFDENVSEWATSLHLHLHCRCWSTNVDVDARRVG
jgi:hypothetical protein